MVALGGIRIRVPADALEEARDLLREVAARPEAVRPYIVDNRVMNVVLVILFCVLLLFPRPAAAHRIDLPAWRPTALVGTPQMKSDPSA